uniref:Uncharacterized protein n=1 Tax=Oryza punctata TaxID=4537 RepID=A0A0E0LLI2_ORYPU
MPTFHSIVDVVLGLPRHQHFPRFQQLLRQIRRSYRGSCAVRNGNRARVGGRRHHPRHRMAVAPTVTAPSVPAASNLAPLVTAPPPPVPASQVVVAPHRVQVQGVQYCIHHGWTAVVTPAGEQFSIPLEMESPPAPLAVAIPLPTTTTNHVAAIKLMPFPYSRTTGFWTDRNLSRAHGGADTLHTIFISSSMPEPPLHTVPASVTHSPWLPKPHATKQLGGMTYRPDRPPTPMRSGGCRPNSSWQAAGHKGGCGGGERWMAMVVSDGGSGGGGDDCGVGGGGGSGGGDGAQWQWHKRQRRSDPRPPIGPRGMAR